MLSSANLTDEGGMILGQDSGGQWQVHIRERGSERVHATFASEDEACRWFNDELKKMAS